MVTFMFFVPYFKGSVLIHTDVPYFPTLGLIGLNKFYFSGYDIMGSFDKSMLFAIFHSRYMEIQLANKLKRVSKQFLSHALEYQRKLRHVDMKTSCNNSAFSNAILRQIAEHSPHLSSVDNVEITGSGALECFESLMTMDNLTQLHFVCFKISDHTWSCLLKLPKLTSLAIEKLFINWDFDLDEFGSNSRRRKLTHLEIRSFDQFASFCDLQTLKSLYLTIWSQFYHHNDVGTICFGLQRCSNVETLKLNVPLNPIEYLTSLLTSVDLMKSLTNLMLECGFLKIKDWEKIPTKFHKNITKLFPMPIYGLNTLENLSQFRKSPNLHDLEYYDTPTVEPNAVFELLPTLQSLVKGNPFRSSTSCYDNKISVRFASLSKVIRT